MIYGIFKTKKGNILHGADISVFSRVGMTPDGPHILGIDKQCFTLILIVYQKDGALKTFVWENGVENTFDGISFVTQKYNKEEKGTELSLALACTFNLFTEQKGSPWTILRLFKKPFNVNTY